MIFNFFRRFYHALKSQTFVKIAEDPYSTHLPYLIGLNKLHSFQRIVEYGSGLNSTVAFTNRNIFDFCSIISYENYRDWYDQVKVIIDGTNEVDFRFHEGLMCNAVVKEEIEDSDVVFIDCSYSTDARSKTIRSVGSFSPSLCVVHDFENFQYRFSALKTSKYYRFKSLLPNVGVFGTDLDINGCKKIDGIVLKGKDFLDNNDLIGWSEHFDKYL